MEQKIADIIRPVIEDLGYELVAVEMKDGALQIMAEDPKTRNLGVDECAEISRALSAVLDVEDPIKGAYRLEVSSPGIDRPLVKKEDFEDFEGFEAKIELQIPLETGQKRFRGRLRGLNMEKNSVLIDTEDQGEVTLPLEAIRKAKLVLTDELIKAAKQKVMEAR